MDLWEKKSFLQRERDKRCAIIAVRAERRIPAGGKGLQVVTA